MIKQFKNIISIILLLVFIAPSTAKLFHHHEHEHYICSAKTKKHFHEYQEKCLICNFELSNFTKNIIKKYAQNNQFSDNYLNLYHSPVSDNSAQFPFLLRAPPLDKNIC